MRIGQAAIAANWPLPRNGARNGACSGFIAFHATRRPSNCTRRWTPMPRRRRRRFRRVFIDVGRKARFQHFGCEIGQPQLAADMALSQTDGFGQLLVRAEFASVQTSPPTPRLADGAQDVRVFLPVLAGAAIGAQQHLGPTALLADLQRDQNPVCVVGIGYSAAASHTGAVSSPVMRLDQRVLDRRRRHSSPGGKSPLAFERGAA